VIVSLLVISRSQAKKDLKRNWTIAIRGIECGRFRIESYVCAQAKLPGVFMPEVALSAQGVRSDDVSRGRFSRHCAKKRRQHRRGERWYQIRRETVRGGLVEGGLRIGRVWYTIGNFE
jgi:hypothetical protein